MQAQEKQLDSTRTIYKEREIKKLIKIIKKVELKEKWFLKKDIFAINTRLKKGEITLAEANNLKTKAAQKRALNIENHQAIIDNEIALLKRSDKLYQLDMRDEGRRNLVRIGSGPLTGDNLIFIGKESDDTPRRPDKRTYKEIVFAFGFNNAIIEGQPLESSPYRIGGSRFIELGHDWKTRIFNTSNFWRFKYGFSFQWNKFDIKNNKFLVNTNGTTSLEEFSSELGKAKFRTTNLVFPFHLEFGPSKKIEKKNYFRYSTKKKLKIGLGAYAGLNLGNMQKLKYRVDGDRIKDKQKGEFEVSNFVYGLSSYVGFGSSALYVKYDLSPVFKNQTNKQNNISVGLRLDLD
tara:strand:+ start:3564 stop:4607 length:1044 start_codon:yes stop_codon:yes gene_type:complete